MARTARSKRVDDGTSAVVDVADKALQSVSEAYLFAASLWKGEALEGGIQAVEGPWLAELGDDVGSLAEAMQFAKTLFVSPLAPGFFATSEDLVDGDFVHVIAKADFEEGSHPRDANGRFASVSDNPEKWKSKTDAWAKALPKVTKTKPLGEHTMHLVPMGAEAEITVTSKDGRVVGTLYFGKNDPSDERMEGAVEVDPEYRRKGIASAMYQWAEELTGLEFAPAKTHTPHAEALWNQPNRLFGRGVKKADFEESDGSRFAADVSEFSFKGHPDFEATKSRIEREEAARKRIAEEWQKRGDASLIKADWSEHLHPRGPDGKFTSGAAVEVYKPVRIDQLRDIQDAGRVRGGTPDAKQAIRQHQSLNDDRAAAHVMVRQLENDKVEYLDPLTRKWSPIEQWNEDRYRAQILEVKHQAAHGAWNRAFEAGGFASFTESTPQADIDRAVATLAPFQAARDDLGSQISDARFPEHETGVTFGLSEKDLVQGDRAPAETRTPKERNAEIAALPAFGAHSLRISERQLDNYVARSAAVATGLPEHTTPSIRFFIDNPDSWKLREVQIGSEASKSFTPEERATIEGHIRTLHEATAFAETKAPTEPVTLYRGMALDDNEPGHGPLLDALLNVGEEISVNSFASWSANPEVAKDFSRGITGKVKLLHDRAVRGEPSGVLRQNQSFRMVVFTTKTSKGLPVTARKVLAGGEDIRFQREMETVMPPAKYKVTGLRRATGDIKDILFVDLEEHPAVTKGDFDESKINRDDHGRFSGSGGGQGPSTPPRLRADEINEKTIRLPKVDRVEIKSPHDGVQRERSTKLSPALTTSEAVAIRYFTGDGAEEIRSIADNDSQAQYISDAARQKSAEHVRELTATVAKAEALAAERGDEPIQLYRGLTLPVELSERETALLSASLHPGAEISFDRHASWSTRYGVAQNFAGWKGRPVVFSMKTAKGLPVPPEHAALSEEYETVMPPQKCRVVSSRLVTGDTGRISGILLVELEEVSPLTKADFDESKVSRDESGRFASTGGAPRSKKDRDAAIGALPKIRGDSISARQEDVDNHTKRSKEIAARMSVAEQIAVRAYTDKDYELIRAVESNSPDAKNLFTEQLTRVKENIAAINKAIAEAEAESTVPTQLFRGIALSGESEAFFDKLLDSKEIHFDSMSSWSANPEIARKFSSGDMSGHHQTSTRRSVIMSVKTTRGLPIDDSYASYKGESETILSAGRYRVASVKEATSVYGDHIATYVELEELPAVAKADFDESKIRRDDKGRFSSGGGGGAGPTSEKVPPAPGPSVSSASESANSPVKELIRLAREKGGFTIQPINGNEPKTGFAVSPFPAASFVKKLEDLTEEDVYNYLEAHEDKLDDPAVHVGGWVNEKGLVFLDLSVVVETHERAMELALNHDQEGFYDLQAGKTVLTGLAGHATKDPPHPSEG